MPVEVIRVMGSWKPPGGAYENLSKGRGTILFVAGQIPFSSDGKIAEGNIQAQTEQVILNIQEVLKAGGATLKDVAKVTIFTTSIAKNLEGIRFMIRKYGLDNKPGSLIEVSRLVPEKALVEIEALAVVD